MKPIVTWIVLANSRTAHVVANNGPNKGVVAIKNKRWQAKPAIAHADRAGTGHSIAGPGVAGLDQGDPQQQADRFFAKEVVTELAAEAHARTFDRLIIAAGPHMMGLLRRELPKNLKSFISAEIAKDLSGMPIEDLGPHLEEFIAV